MGLFSLVPLIKTFAYLGAIIILPPVMDEAVYQPYNIINVDGGKLPSV